MPILLRTARASSKLCRPMAIAATVTVIRLTGLLGTVDDLDGRVAPASTVGRGPVQKGNGHHDNRRNEEDAGTAKLDSHFYA